VIVAGPTVWTRSRIILAKSGSRVISAIRRAGCRRARWPSSRTLLQQGDHVRTECAGVRNVDVGDGAQLARVDDQLGAAGPAAIETALLVRARAATRSMVSPA